MKRFLLVALAAFFLVGCSSSDGSLTGQATHGTYTAFSAPEPGFRVGNGMVLASDTVVYKTGWYSVNGASWQPLSLSGSAYGVSDSWLADSASASLPASLSGPGEHYVIVYTCSYDEGWDCHGGTPGTGGWQLLIIDPSTACLDSCSSLGFQCGVQTLCGASVDCGGCDVAGYDVGLTCVSTLCEEVASGKTYYVAADGSDGNPGTISQPWATLQKAVYLARPGDIVYLRGGTYHLTSPVFWNPMDGTGVDGTPEALIRYLNYPGESPILDFTDTLPSGNPGSNSYNAGFSLLNTDYVHLRGMTVRNVRQTRDYVECLGVYAYDSTNLVFENMVVHNVDGNAFRFFGGWRYPACGIANQPIPPGCTGPPYLYPDHALYPGDTTYFINCDAYNNWDWRPRTVPLPNATSPHLGGAADGWKAYNEPGSSIVFEGCRAWNNSDDGFDPTGPADYIIRNTWSFENGALDGDGTGFKVGGLRDNSIITPKVTECIAAANRVGYFLLEYEDYSRTDARFYNNLAYKEGYFFSRNSLYPTVLSVYRNNVAYGGNAPFSNAYQPYTESHNTWDFVGGFPGWVDAPEFNVTPEDFISLEVSQLRGPRRPDGSLPDSTFGHLRPDSELIDAGMAIPGHHCATAGAHPGEDCREWQGAAPDLGPFEYVPIEPANACHGPGRRSCVTIENAFGTQSRRCVLGSWSDWNACAFVACDEGYVLREGTCVRGPGWSDELVTNGGFEGTLDGWTASAGGWTTGSYQTYGGNSHPPQAGHYCAYIASSSTSASLYQDVSLADFADHIDAGLVVANVSGWGVSSPMTGGLTKIKFMFLDSVGAVISTPLETGYVDNPVWWEAKLSEEPVPAGTRYVRVWGNTRDRYGYADAAGDLDSFSVKVNILEG